jgi:branched-chain amino acid transport system substrate-binding protein
MKRRSWRTPVAITCAAALALGLAACGDDDDSSTATTAGAPTTAGRAAPTTEAAAGTTEAGADTTEASTDSTEAGGTAAASGGGEFGLIDGVYKGGDGFELDPATCPDDWDPMQGITDDSITFFSSMPKAGPLAGFGLIADGINSYFKYINDKNGGVDGHKLTLEVKDDAYMPDKTKSNVDEALGENKYAGMLTIIGTPNNLAVWDTLNDECMPQLLNGTGYPGWGDITNHPWTTGMQLDYASEAGLWAEWLKKEHPDKTKVAALTFNNDFGKSYVSGFNHFIKDSDIQVVDQEFHEPTAPDVTNQLTTIAASGADVVLLETTGTFCTQAMAELEKNTTFNPIVIMSGTCGSLSQFFQPLVDQGLTGADTYIIQYLKDVNDAQFANDDIVKLFHETAKAQGLDDKQTTYATGWIFAMFMEAIVKEAATYEGGINRGNIAVAARHITYQNPFALDGIKQGTDFAKDAYLFEGGQMAKYTIDPNDKTKLGSFVKEGELIDNNGDLGNYDDVLASGGG